MLEQFFTYYGLDDITDSEIQFYHCKLLKDIGDNKEGTEIPVICFNFETGEMTFYDNDNIITSQVEFELKIKE